MESLFVSRSEEETFEFARKLTAELPTPIRILLIGELGSGKTTFTKGLAAGFGLLDVDEVSSPTFTLVNRYLGRVPIHHIDLYRVASHDLYDLGIEEILDDPEAVTVIEWAERLQDVDVEPSVCICLSYVDEHTRHIEFRPMKNG